MTIVSTYSRHKNASGSKKWWYTVNKITGRKANHGSLSIDPSIISSYFQKINTDDNYTPSEPIRVDKCSTFGIKKELTKSIQYLPKLFINNCLEDIHVTPQKIYANFQLNIVPEVILFRCVYFTYI